jgi:hypothetical protein
LQIHILQQRLGLTVRAGPMVVDVSQFKHGSNRVCQPSGRRGG